MKKPYPKTLNRARIIRLYKAGKNVAQIARLAGYPAGHGNNRVSQFAHPRGPLLTRKITTGQGAVEAVP